MQSLVLIWKDHYAAWVGLIGMTAFAAWLFGASFSNGTLALATTRQPEKFTELYFNNYESLQKLILVGKPMEVAFSVVNHEAQAMVYHCKIWVEQNGKSKLMEAIDIAVPDGKTAVYTYTFVPEKPSTLYQIRIEIPKLKQFISARLKS